MQLEILLVPAHVSDSRWIAAAIDVLDRIFIFMDSMKGGDSTEILTFLRKWLFDEATSKHGLERANDLNISAWRSAVRHDLIPLQSFGGSCGIFVMFTIECLIRRVDLNLDQRDTSLLRKRTALYLLEGALTE